MTKRYSSSQINNMLRKAQRDQQRAIDKHNRNVKNAINKYNREVRTYNARVRADRQRLKTELARLSRQPIKVTVTRHVTYRASVQTLYDSYTRLEDYALAQQLDPRYNQILDLSERETANSLEVANRVFGVDIADDTPPEELVNTELLDGLRKISPDLDDRWNGAIFSLSPRNPDAARHFCTSAREIITQILEIKAPDASVFALLPTCERTERGNPTRRSKIRYFLHRQNMNEDPLEEFIENDMENIVQLFYVFNEATHGTAGTFNLSQLNTIKRRVEDGIKFLIEIIGDI